MITIVPTRGLRALSFHQKKITMFDELEKYQKNDHFFFMPKVELEKVCNAPKNECGVFIVYELKDGRVELVYIGSSGKVKNDGSKNHENGGLYNHIVNGSRFGDVPIKKSWNQKLIDENIDALDIYWYVTFDSIYDDIPTFVEAITMQGFYDVHGRLPRWNKEF